MDRTDVPPAATSVTRASGRRAFCPLCGAEQMLTADPRNPEAALCEGRCSLAWRALSALKESEAVSELVADRRRAESAARLAHAPSLSELLLGRWRSGDWAVLPEDVLRQLC